MITGGSELSHFCIRRSSEGALYFPHSNTVIDIEMGQKYWCKFKSKSVIMSHIWWVMRSIMMNHIWWVIVKYMRDSYDMNHKIRIIIWFKRHYFIICMVWNWFWSAWPRLTTCWSWVVINDHLHSTRRILFGTHSDFQGFFCMLNTAKKFWKVFYA